MTARRTPGLVLIAFATVLGVFAVAGVCSGMTQLTNRDGEAQAAEATARAFVLALGTFDHRAQQDYTARLSSLATGSLRDSLTAALVDPAASSAQRTMTSRIDAASVTALADGVATVTVTSTQQRRWVDPVLGQSFHESVTQLVTCQLVREGGRWLVSGLEPQAIATVRPGGR